MARPDIIFADVNTIWHRRLAEALAEQTRVVALAPAPRLVPETRRTEGALDIRQVFVPPGWASKTAFIGQRLLKRQVADIAASLDNPVLMLTSPAYEQLSRLMGNLFPVVTYTADDYESYEGWPNARQREVAMQQRACLSAYVSDALRRRAVEEDAIDAGRTFVSPNATEPRFAAHDGGEPSALDGRQGPVMGVLGGLSDRLDLALIERVIGLPEVGTFLVAGPVDEAILAAHPALSSDKVVITGRLPHSDMHLYAQAMDAALIPYAETRLNHFCSPMRLFDHLATGVPIFALPTCDLVSRYDAERITVAPADRLLGAIAQGISASRLSQTESGLYWSDRASALLAAIEERCVMRGMEAPQ